MVVQMWGAAIVGTVLAGFSADGAAATPIHQPAAHSGRIEACETCHRFPATRTHVTGVRPTFKVPAIYPLGANGELTCLTCHDATASTTTKGKALLRGALEDSSFCLSC